MSETSREHLESDQNGAQHRDSNGVSTVTLIVAAFIMALPASVPILVMVEPSFAPFVGEVDTSETGTVGFMVGLSAVLLAINWGFLYAIYRWLNSQTSRG